MKEPSVEDILVSILTPEAYSRLGCLKIYYKEKYKTLESTLISLYRNGQIQRPIDEDAFLKLVDSTSEEKKNIKVIRKKTHSDLDDI